MARIKLSIEKNRDIFLYTSRVENLFISEYMPDAPGDYVKVFLLGLMYAQYDEEMDSRKIGIVLGLSEDEVEEAWIYWASRGVIRRRVELSDNGMEVERIEVISLIEELYGKAPDVASAASAAEAAGTDPASEDVASYEADDADDAVFDDEPDVDIYLSLDEIEETE